MSEIPEGQTAQVHGVTLHYVKAGAGPKTLVLIHGWPQTLHAWRKVIPRLAETHTVLAVDLRGVGGSSAPADGYDKETLAQDIHALVSQLKLGNVYVVGHDLGAMVAYAYGRQFPDDTRGIGIVDMPIPGIDGWELAASSYPAWHFGFHQNVDNGVGVAETLVDGHQAFYFRSFIDRFGTHPEAITESDIETYARAYGDPAHLKAGFELYRTFPQDVTANTERQIPLAVPILLAFGEHSNAPVMPLVSQGLRDAGANDVRSVVVTDSGHWPAEEQPEQVVSTLSTFLDSIDG
jgi:pimeloyl-ACP methyl ester carboxylesterase